MEGLDYCKGVNRCVGDDELGLEEGEEWGRVQESPDAVNKRKEGTMRGEYKTASKMVYVCV